MNDKSRIVSMLFADLAGYSGIGNDQLYAKLQSLAEEFHKSLPDHELVYYNTWGDAFFICIDDPMTLLEMALDLRDRYRNLNWIRAGFPKALQIRIAVHLDKVTIISNGDTVSNVIGRNVNAAARIEPIVPSNSIYCSESFQRHTFEDASGFAKFKPMGTRALAKGFGEMPLFEVLREYEQFDTTDSVSHTTAAKRPFSMTVPKIRKEFTDMEKDKLQRQGFQTIRDYFRDAAQRLKEFDPETSAECEDIRDLKFTCKVFVRGNERAACQIWIAQDRYNRGIHYLGRIDDRDSSSNEIIHIEDDGYDLYFRALGMAFTSGIDPNAHLSAEEVAHGLWQIFVQQLT